MSAIAREYFAPLSLEHTGFTPKKRAGVNIGSVQGFRVMDWGKIIRFSWLIH